MHQCLIFYMMQRDKICDRVPHPRRGSSPEKKVKPDLSSQVKVGKVVLLPDVQAQDARGRMGATLRCSAAALGMPRNRGSGVSQRSGRVTHKVSGVQQCAR
ncbi:uncharacterized protein FYW23_008048 isoform 2-T2 [Sylvia borin]